MRVFELAAWLGSDFEGAGEREIRGVAALDAAGEDDLSFAAGRKALDAAASSKAGCLLVPVAFENTHGRTVIRVADPRGAFARAVARFHPPVPPTPGVHPTAVLGNDVVLGEGVSVGPRATIADGTRVGSGTSIGAGAALGRNVTVGSGGLIHANVTVYDGVTIGHRVVLHSGCVLGADGFGFVFERDHYEKFPQVGRLELGDDVEIGANTTVDRAALGVTSIGHGVKLDNLVHIGHNCRIGNHVVIAAQTGLSGGVIVEDYAVIGGQVGIGDKARIESRATLGSGCGVLTSKIVRGGQVVWGTPARPLREYLAQLAHMARLPALAREVAELKKRLNERGI
ncbi:MAG: UDP-3-O-(3-hydroxymyristoyl)glucosamine N-acyltransferase [Acidobacteria bacterium]|nr:UDP-3-O-(3-hydroxymyristoyl)glucosamine N-acyltransferase [Acidobacteriota bacterium]